MLKCLLRFLGVFVFLSFILVLPVARYAYSKAEEITEQEIISHIRYLASDELEGRKTGTNGCEKAANYIASHFKGSGLKPLGDNGTYFQNFSFVSRIKLGKSNSLTVELGEKKKKLDLSKDFLPLSFSSDGTLSGDLVFAGYGISAPQLNYDDYTGIDVKDQIVLVLRYTPEGYDSKSPFYSYVSLRHKATNAREKGAKGIIFITPSSHKEEEDLGGMRFDFSFTDSGIHAIILKRKIAEEILRFAGKEMKELEQEMANKKTASFFIPNSEIHLHTKLIRGKSSTSNVIGFLEGSHPIFKDEAIIIGAHYDHIGLDGKISRGNIGTNKHGNSKIHNGADDNASGVAGLLELAQYFFHYKDSLQRSLIFIAFSGEEMGLLGSSYYVKNPKIHLEKIVAMLNMDMIGRLRNNTLTIIGIGSSPQWQPLLDSANSRVGLTLKTRDSGFAPSDQTFFYAKNIPVLQFFTGVHTDHHTPSDDWQKINSAGEKKALILISQLIWKLNQVPQRIAFSKAKNEEVGEFSRVTVYLGTIPDYSEEVDGVKLMDVRKGSPAEKAGLKSGDIIVGLAGETVTNIYDYVYALRQVEPGVPAEIMVIRNKKQIKLSVAPELRMDRD